MDNTNDKGNKNAENNLEGCPSETQLAGKAELCKNCPSMSCNLHYQIYVQWYNKGQGLCQSLNGKDPDQEQLNIRMKAIKHKIVVVSGKGGIYINNK